MREPKDEFNPHANMLAAEQAERGFREVTSSDESFSRNQPRIQLERIGRIGERVAVISGNRYLSGSINKRRLDTSGKEIYTITLDDSKATTSGLMFARIEELKFL